MKRIIWHWDAGTGKATALAKDHYHFIIEADGKVVTGHYHPTDNLVTSDGRYAAHTLNANTGAIGVAVSAMAGAVERPFNAGRYPITPKQVEALVALTAKLCADYNIPVTRETVLSHAEVQPTLGIKQKGKWDITWLPGMDKAGDPVQVGDRLRNMVSLVMKPVSKPPEKHSVPAPKPIKSNWLADLVASILKALGVK